MFTRIFYFTLHAFLSFPPPRILESFHRRWRAIWKNRIKKFFRRDINAEEPWTRATLGGNVLTGRSTFFSPLVCRAQKYRDPLDEICSFQKKKKKNSSSSPLALFFPARPFFSPTPSPTPLHSFVHEDFDGDSSPTSAPVIAIIHTTEEDPRYDTKRGTNRPESGAKSDKSRRWTNLRRIWEQEGEKKIGKSVPRDTNNNK